MQKNKYEAQVNHQQNIVRENIVGRDIYLGQDETLNYSCTNNWWTLGY